MTGHAEAEITGGAHDLARLVRHYDPAQVWYQLEEIVAERTYLRHGVQVGAGDVVLDVGANVGVAALFFALECDAGRVHSFEPVAPLFELLSQNLAPFPTCVPHAYGLGSSSGSARITYYPKAASMSSLYPDPAADRGLVRAALVNRGMTEAKADEGSRDLHLGETLNCELRTLTSVIEEESLDRVDLLKVDVERAELDVLRGIDDQHWPLIGQIVVELHDEAGRCELIETVLTGRGFRTVTEQEPSMRGTDVYVLYGIRE